jgi:hypothetical protein
MSLINYMVHGPDGMYKVIAQLTKDPDHQTYELEGPQSDMILHVYRVKEDPDWLSTTVKKRERLSLLERVLHLRIGDDFHGKPIGKLVWMDAKYEEYKYGDGKLCISEEGNKALVRVGDERYEPHPEYASFENELNKTLKPLNDNLLAAINVLHRVTTEHEATVRKIRNEMNAKYESEIFKGTVTSDD